MKEYLDPSALHWMRKPAMYAMDSERLVLETEPYTSFQSLSYDSTDAFGMTLDPMESFAFSVRIDYQFRSLEDECGILLHHSNSRWAKAGIERRPDGLDIACTVYANGYGDRSCRLIGSGIRWMYLRVLYWRGNCRFQYSFNGEKYSDMRWLHFASQREPVTAGIYACSPQDSYFDCTFSCMQVKQII